MEIGKFLKFSDGVVTTNEYLNEYLSNKLKNYISTVFIHSLSRSKEEEYQYIYLCFISPYLKPKG